MAVNNRLAGQKPIPVQYRSETRVWRKKECAEAKRRYRRKEGKHLNSSALYPPLSKLPRLVPPICVFHLTSPPPHNTHPHSPSPSYRAFQRGCGLIVSQDSSPDSLLQGWTLGIRNNSDHNHWDGLNTMCIPRNAPPLQLLTTEAAALGRESGRNMVLARQSPQTTGQGSATRS